MSGKRRKLIIFLFVLLFIAAGFFREYVFKSINLRLSYLYHKLPDGELTGILSPLNSVSYVNLYYLKFALTLIFIFLFFSLSLLFFRNVFPAGRGVAYSIYLYASLLFLAVVIYFAGAATGTSNSLYPFSRFITGILQSPLPVMFIIPSLYLANKNNR